ncbi:probable calcium-binding protein CML46 [Cornus florida]|uniref:probable calcium-binding protein CML46 n=1 Tax=Cornus florida TaxID=4283 RepID=UPI0028A06C14|nr:probable calcium-binding protein CML46 [Cornus florida]
MEKSNAISTAILVLLENNSSSPFSFVGIILLCIILSWIVTLHDFYSCFRSLFQTLLHFLFWRWKSCFSQGKKAGAEFSTIQKPCSNENVTDNGKFKEVEMVMERLGIFCDSDDVCDELQIGTLFEEKEPSLEEAKEAFLVFDENNDGFIDAGELKNVLCSLGVTEVSEVKCQRMIGVFDENGDGRIDFGEFLKVVEHSFC